MYCLVSLILTRIWIDCQNLQTRLCVHLQFSFTGKPASCTSNNFLRTEKSDWKFIVYNLKQLCLQTVKYDVEIDRIHRYLPRRSPSTLTVLFNITAYYTVYKLIWYNFQQKFADCDCIRRHCCAKNQLEWQLKPMHYRSSLYTKGCSRQNVVLFVRVRVWSFHL